MGPFLPWFLGTRGINKEWVHGTQQFFRWQNVWPSPSSFLISPELRKPAINLRMWAMSHFPKCLDPGQCRSTWSLGERDGRTTSVHTGICLCLLAACALYLTSFWGPEQLFYVALQAIHNLPPSMLSTPACLCSNYSLCHECHQDIAWESLPCPTKFSSWNDTSSINSVWHSHISMSSQHLPSFI